MAVDVSRRQTMIGLTSAALASQSRLSLAATPATQSLSLSLCFAQWQRCIITDRDEQNRRVYVRPEYSATTEATASLQRVNLLCHRTYRRKIENDDTELASLLPIDFESMSTKQYRRSLRNRTHYPWQYLDDASEPADVVRGKAFFFSICRLPLTPPYFDLSAEGSINYHDHGSDDEHFSLKCKLDCGQNSDWLSRQQRRHDPLASWIFDMLCSHMKAQPYPLGPDEAGIWMPHAIIHHRANTRYV